MKHLEEKNKIFNRILKERSGHYCHVIEVNDIYDIISVIEGVIDCYNDQYTEKEYIEFFESLTIIYLGEDSEEENKVYDFSCTEYIKNSI